MTTTAEVIYEEGALRLLTPVSYPEGTRLSALLTLKPAPDKGDAAYLLTLPRLNMRPISLCRSRNVS